MESLLYLSVELAILRLTYHSQARFGTFVLAENKCSWVSTEIAEPKDFSHGSKWPIV
jgi:hypothetical protein